MYETSSANQLNHYSHGKRLMKVFDEITKLLQRRKQTTTLFSVILSFEVSNNHAIMSMCIISMYTGGIFLIEYQQLTLERFFAKALVPNNRHVDAPRVPLGATGRSFHSKRHSAASTCT
jgi:hypothetical protein